MRIRMLTSIGVLLLALGCDQQATVGAPAVLGGLHPIPVAGLGSGQDTDSGEAIRALLGDAHIVGIGESRHDTREQTLVKSSLVKTMIAEHGFRTLILEESFAHALAIDAYVTHGDGDARSALSGLAGWYLWDTEEMVELLDWIREFNESKDRDQVVRVLGMDVTAPASGLRDAIRAADALDPGGDWSARDYGLEWQEGDFWPRTLERYAAVPEARRDLVSTNLADLRRLLESGSAGHGESRSWNMRLVSVHAEVAELAHRMFSADSIAEIGAERERAMARVVDWILNQMAATSRTVIWTHNLHAAKSGFRMPQMGDGEFLPMGVILDRDYGADYLAIGAAFGTGYFPPQYPPGERSFEALDNTTLDGAIGELGEGPFLVSLQNLEKSSSAATWLAQDREWRMQDAMAILVPLQAFDAIYYVDEVSRATLTPGARERARVDN